MTIGNMGHPVPDGNEILPAGVSQEYFEARQIVSNACVAASGAGIPVEVVASAAIGAIIEMMVEKHGDEHHAVRVVAGYLRAYEALAGQGLLSSGGPFAFHAERV